MAGLLSKLGFGSSAAEVPQIVQGEIPALRGADLAIAYFSSRAGGDLHDFLRVGPHRFLFGLLDVAGKRETSGPVLQAALACFRSSGEKLFADPELNESDVMIELSRRLNLEIMRAAGGVRSCPAFAGCYNEELGTVCYVNAGHTPGLLRDDASVVELPATGLPLGLFSLAPTDARIVGLGQKPRWRWSRVEWWKRSPRTRNSVWRVSKARCKQDLLRPKIFRRASCNACRTSCTWLRSTTT